MPISGLGAPAITGGACGKSPWQALPVKAGAILPERNDRDSLLEEKGRRSALVARSAEGDAIPRFVLGLNYGMTDQGCEDRQRSLRRRNFRFTLRACCTLVIRAPRQARVNRRASRRSGVRRVDPHRRHRTMMLPIPPAAGGQIRIRVGEDERRDQREAEQKR
jgi:hypothetical protein